MASNNDSGWILQQAMFQRAAEGAEVQKELAACLEMLNASHEFRKNNVIRSRPTTYVVSGTNTQKGHYEITIAATVLINDGERDVECSYDFVFNYKKVPTSKKAALSEKSNSIVNDRLAVWYSSQKWHLIWLVDSNEEAHKKGYVHDWYNNYEGHVITTSFPSWANH